MKTLSIHLLAVRLYDPVTLRENVGSHGLEGNFLNLSQ
jgi:hypothetical protein